MALSPSSGLRPALLALLSKLSRQNAHAAHLHIKQWAVACAIAQNGSHLSVEESSEAAVAAAEA